MHLRSRHLAAAVALAPLLAAAPALAATTAQLDFSGDICGASGTQACSNGVALGSNYGSIPGLVSLVWDGDRDTAGMQNVLIWTTGGYSTADRAAYATTNSSGISVTLTPAAGYEVTLDSFSFSNYIGRQRIWAARVIDLATNDVLSSFSLDPVPNGIQTESNPSTWGSTTGILLEFGPNAWDVGLTELSFSVNEASSPPPPTPSVIPLPPAGLLLMAGLFGLAAVRRRA